MVSKNKIIFFVNILGILATLLGIFYVIEGVIKLNRNFMWYAGALLFICSGVGILLRKEWGRIIFYILSILYILRALRICYDIFINKPFSNIFLVSLFLTLLYFLILISPFLVACLILTHKIADSEFKSSL